MAKKPDLMSPEEITEANRKAETDRIAGNTAASDVAKTSPFTNEDITGAALTTAKEAGMDADEILTGGDGRRMSPAGISETQQLSTDALQARLEMLEMNNERMRSDLEARQGNVQSLYALVRWLFDMHHRGADLAQIIRDHATDLAGSEVLDRTVVRHIPTVTRGTNQPPGLALVQRGNQFTDTHVIPAATLRNLPGVTND